jgi:hypothetical protein
MSKFHRGQAVEVLACLTDSKLERPSWRKAKIVSKPDNWDCTMYKVQFAKIGTRDVFHETHIRAASSL